ncbi:Ryanodine receptor [Gryllus bimaculatus]|nr:Ryanodine receptor [Gryllus bimaculatus]
MGAGLSGPSVEAVGNEMFDAECLKLINEYFYGVRIFPGQDPTHVYVGWVTTQYHLHSQAFSQANVRRASVEVTDDYGRMEPDTKLFPAIFVEATSKEILQIELGRTSTTLPLSAAVLQNSERHVIPQFPPRLKVQCLKPHQWARVPNQALQVHALKLSDVRGWSMLCEDPVSMLALHLPEEDRCMDILELIEMERLLSFHAHTLTLYAALCYQSNYRAAHALCRHVDQKQLLYAICSEYLSGPLRQGFYDLLIALHLESHANTMEVCKNEYIIPLGPELKELYEDPDMGHSLRSLKTESVRPQMKMTEITDNIENIRTLYSPHFPLDVVKNYVMAALDEAVQINQVHNRDPIGGSNENLFLPLLKLVDRLLLVGMLTDEDVEKLLIMVDPETWDPTFEKDGKDEHRKGLLHMKMAEGAKLQMCYLLHHLCDTQLRHRVEAIIAFSHDFVGDLQASDLPSAVAAKKTREFRCPPREQMNAILSFKNLPEDDKENMPCGEELIEALSSFHGDLLGKVSLNALQEPEESERLYNFINAVKELEEEPKPPEEPPRKTPEEIFRKVLIKTIVRWAEESQIETSKLYDTVGELIRALKKTYIINSKTKGDVALMWVGLSQIRALLPVQMSQDEEELMRERLWKLVNNHTFFQHPDLIRILRVHENVMADTSHEMVVACCRFLCYFCRTSRQNQKAMFDHFSFLLENSNILLSRPSLRGSTPLDVAYSSLMENTELALALREHYLEKIAIYLSRCGLQSNSELVEKGYPDLGWDPVEGERYLDFLRFCVWVNGESVEENANLVIRLLIRRPECLGPALRGEGEGLLRAIIDANKMSERIAERRKLLDEAEGTTAALGFEHPLPEGEDDEDYIDTGSAILNFYCTLVDLLGRCAPDFAVILQGKNESLRARAILRSLVPLEDLQGVLSLRFTLMQPAAGEDRPKSDMPSGLLPINKQSIVLFLERVYGIETQELFFRLLEEAFLPDLRAATMLGRNDGYESDMALAMNRYIGNAILPLLIKHAKFYSDADAWASLLDATLHTVYRLSKNRMLTKGQRECVSDFLVALTSQMQPSMLLKLLRKLTVDVSKLTEYTTVALRLLMLHYERCAKYYGASSGLVSSSDEEKRLTMMLFSNIFDSLSKMALPCLTAIGCALPPDYSLSKNYDDMWDGANDSADPDGPYQPKPINTGTVVLTNDMNNIVQKFSEHYHDAWASRKLESGWTYGEQWSDSNKTHPRLKPYSMLNDYEKERYKEPVRESLKALIALGWTVEHSETDLPSNNRNSTRRASKAAPLVPYDLLTDKEKRKDRERSQEFLKYMQYQSFKLHRPTRGPAGAEAEQGAQGAAVELRFAYSLLEKLIQYLDTASINMKLLKPSTTFSRRNSFKTCTRRHQVLRQVTVVLPPTNLLTAHLPRLSCRAQTPSRRATQTSSSSPRLTWSFSNPPPPSSRAQLLDVAPATQVRGPSSIPPPTFSRRNSFKTCTRDIKFFSKVVLPLMEKYFSTHRNYFIAVATATNNVGAASLKEKEMVASLFCKLASLLRSRLAAFGADVRITNCPEFIRTSMLTFFNNTADDLNHTIQNLQEGKYSHLRGTHLKTSTSLFYVNCVVLPVLTAMFDHLAACEYGSDLLHVLARMEQSMPTLEAVLAEVDAFAESDKTHVDAPHIIDVILPLLCSYLPFWWAQGPDNVSPQEGAHVSMVTADHMNQLLKNVLKLIKKNIGNENAPWMTRIAAYTQQIIINSSEELLKDPFLPLVERVKKRTDNMFHKEESLRGFIKSATDDTSQVESQIQEDWQLLVRDIYAFYPLLIKYVDLQRNHWMRNNVAEAEDLYNNVADIFNIWSKSQYFIKEEQNFISANEIDNMTLIMPTATRRSAAVPEGGAAAGGGGKKKKKHRDKKRDKDKELQASLMVACLKRLLPVGLNLFAGREQELVQLTLPDKIDPADEMSWQHYLYSKLGTQGAVAEDGKPPKVEDVVERIVAMAKVLYGLHMQATKQAPSRSGWKRVLSAARKRAAIACLRSEPLYTLRRHRAINIFIRSYYEMWLEEENVGQEVMIEDLTQSFEDAELKKQDKEEEENKPDPLNQLVTTFCRGAMTERSGALQEDVLYMSYAEIAAKSCGEEEEEGGEEEGGEEEGGASIHEQEMEKQKLLFHQARLANRGVAEMVLLHISACKGLPSDMVMNTLKLGISILRGGNSDIQMESIMDFYWHYSSKELIDPAGKANFFKAIGVASQVFNTLTEVIQGPCTQNQQALAHSRLWDAVGGFLFLFSHMQDKLSKHSSQVDLLKELLNLQKDMITMMLSMLEGNVVNGTIGKQMVDTLVESASNVELILKYFDMFLKLKDLTESASFLEVDANKDGWITEKDFKDKMEQQKSYTPEEIEFLLTCCETNHDGKIDYITFTDKFHEPAKEIGFNLAVLLTNLSEHMPNEPRLARFLETAGSVLNYFEPFLGRIEIMGGSKRIERVYFEIKESNIEQWEKPQIKGGDKEKLEAFVNFCEDAIFEMTHASGLMAVEESGGGSKVREAQYTYLGDDDEERSGKDPFRRGLQAVKDGLSFSLAFLKPSNLKTRIAEMQQMTFPEIIQEEPKEEPQEEERAPLRVLPALPGTPDEPTAPSQMQAFGLDITKEDNGQFHMAPHESAPPSPQSSLEEGGESTPEEAGEEHAKAEGAEGEAPPTLADLLGGEAARKAAAATAEAAAQQQAAMAAVEAENKQEVVTEPSAVSQVWKNACGGLYEI